MHEKLSLTGRRWVLRRETPLTRGEDIVQLLRSERGLLDALDPQSGKLSDPFLFAEMGRAVDRITSAIAKKETVAIFGDYDADGITGTAQLVRYFRRHGIEPIAYLPHRMKEGYGMKKPSIDTLHAKGVTLIITVDTGISANGEIAYAASLGMDVIVTDHHHPRSGRPPAFAVIHPLIPTTFPNPHLCGSGVAFMLVRALEHPQVAWDGIDEDVVLATIGTIGDLVPLTGENRVLVMHGLRFLETLPAGPLRSLMESVQMQKVPLSSRDIAFRVVPRINASGRMDDPRIALDCLLTGGDALQQLNDLNVQRQAITSEWFENAEESVRLNDSIICIADERFSAGVVGLIAGKLTEKYGRPSLVAAISGDICTASLRSIPEFDISGALSHPSVAPLLLSYGGHSQAAGCTFRFSNFEVLRLALCAYMADAGFTADALIPTLRLDMPIHTDHLSAKFVKQLEALEPFGQGNDQPSFLLREQPIDLLRRVGGDGQHLQAKIGGVQSIGFGLGSLADQVAHGEIIDVACRIGMNSWNGRENVQLQMVDMRTGDGGQRTGASQK